MAFDVGLPRSVYNALDSRRSILRNECRANPRQLVEVQQIVAGVEPEKVSETFLKAFRVKANSEQIGGAEPLPHAQVGAAQSRKLIEGLMDVGISVAEAIAQRSWS